MKKLIFLVIVVILASCQKEKNIEPNQGAMLTLNFKSSYLENILELNMPGVFQGTAENYSPDYPFLWIINGDTTESSELTRQISFEELGMKEISLVVFNEEGVPSSVSISIQVIEEYPYQREFQCPAAVLMENGQYLYNIWVNLDYYPGNPESYYWFYEDENSAWVEEIIHNIHFSYDSVKWGAFSLLSYNRNLIWTFGAIEDETWIFANISGSTHYLEEKQALYTSFYDGVIIPAPFDYPLIPGFGDEVCKIEKSNQTVYFNFLDYSDFQVNPILEIKNSSGTVRRAMEFVGGTGWAKANLIDDDLNDNLIILRFGNYTNDGTYVLSDNPSAQWYNEQEEFLVLKIFEI